MAVVLVIVAFIVVVAIHGFLFWWVRRPGHDAVQYRGAERVVPGNQSLWQAAFGCSYASPVIVGIVQGWAGAEPADIVIWAMAVFVTTQVLLFTTMLMLALVTRARRSSTR